GTTDHSLGRVAAAHGLPRRYNAATAQTPWRTEWRTELQDLLDHLGVIRRQRKRRGVYVSVRAGVNTRKDKWSLCPRFPSARGCGAKPPWGRHLACRDFSLASGLPHGRILHLAVALDSPVPLSQNEAENPTLRGVGTFRTFQRWVLSDAQWQQIR